MEPVLNEYLIRNGIRIQRYSQAVYSALVVQDSEFVILFTRSRVLMFVYKPHHCIKIHIHA